MLQRTPKLDTENIHEIIRRKEKSIGYKLSIEDFDFLTTCVLNFTDAAVTKYIDGAKEHEDESSSSFPESGLSFVTEAHKEAIDLWMYLQAEQHKQRKEQKQCKTVVPS